MAEPTTAPAPAEAGADVIPVRVEIRAKLPVLIRALEPMNELLAAAAAVDALDIAAATMYGDGPDLVVGYETTLTVRYDEDESAISEDGSGR